LSCGEDKKFHLFPALQIPALSLPIMDRENRITIQAAGGLVENEKGEILFIFRRGKWDLPKGKLDPGETLESCALREVREETGVGQLELKKFLLVTKHEYEESGLFILKETHWWLMKTNSNQQLKPQAEEDITGVKWMSPGDFKIVQQNTYPSILEVLRTGDFKFTGLFSF
jgi:8-oxo-dGTP pyrophosphatase MutT (NUDIX family)